MAAAQQRCEYTKEEKVVEVTGRQKMRGRESVREEEQVKHTWKKKTEDVLWSTECTY